MPRILQLSDLHLTSAPHRRAWGTDVWTNFRQTLRELDRFEPFDRLLLTGDLANRPSRGAYELLRESLQPWFARVRLIPGNHDGRQLLRQVFADRFATERSTFVDRLGGFRLIGLDSKRAWRVHGRIGRGQLDWLRQTLATDPTPALLFLHHPPVPVGTWWLDKDVLRDADAFAEVIEGGNVHAVFCGHVHQAFAGTAGGAPFFACPSTAYQFRPGSTRPGAVEARTPALRIIELTDDSLSTRVERLATRG